MMKNNFEGDPPVVVMCNDCGETGWIRTSTLRKTDRQPIARCLSCGGKMTPPVFVDDDINDDKKGPKMSLN